TNTVQLDARSHRVHYLPVRSLSNRAAACTKMGSLSGPFWCVMLFQPTIKRGASNAHQVSGSPAPRVRPVPAPSADFSTARCVRPLRGGFAGARELRVGSVRSGTARARSVGV